MIKFKLNFLISIFYTYFFKTHKSKILYFFSPDELYLALVTSTRAHAKIVNINIEAASQAPGFVSWVDHRDVPEKNDLGMMGEVFAEDEVRNNFYILINCNVTA